MNWTINQTVDLSRGYTPVVWPDALMVSGDVGAHTWRVTVLDGGAAADISGATITGNFLRDDGATVQVAGSASGNIASVTLTDACYAVEGKLVGTMRAVSGGANVTLAAVVYTVKLLTSGYVVDPGVTYQDFTIDASPAGTYADLAALISTDPDHTKIYITLDDGNWCYFNGMTWVAGGVYQAASVVADIAAINAAINENLFNLVTPTYETGSYSVAGARVASEDNLRTVNAYWALKGSRIICPSNMLVRVIEVSADVANFTGYVTRYFDYASEYNSTADTFIAFTVKLISGTIQVSDLENITLKIITRVEPGPFEVRDEKTDFIVSQGGFSVPNGIDTATDYRIRSGYIPVNAGTIIESDVGYFFYLVEYDSNGTTHHTSIAYTSVAVMKYTVTYDCWIRWAMGRVDGAVIATSESTHIHVYLAPGALWTNLYTRKRLRFERGTLLFLDNMEQDSTNRIRSAPILVKRGGFIEPLAGYEIAIKEQRTGDSGAALLNTITAADYISTRYTVTNDCYLRVSVRRVDNADFTPEEQGIKYYLIGPNEAPIYGFISANDKMYTSPASNQTTVYNKSVADIYALYDALVDDVYVTSETLGQDESATYDIKAYRFTPPAISRVAGVAITGRAFRADTDLKIVVDSAIHGPEKPAVLALYNAMYNLVNNWETNEILEFLRWNAEIIVVPLLNPYGFTNMTRGNANGVDLNRNFDTAHFTLGSNDPLSQNYRGSARASEAETVILQNLLLSEMPNLYFGLHTYGVTSDYDLMFSWEQTGDGVRSDLISALGSKVIKATTINAIKNYSFPDNGKYVSKIGFSGRISMAAQYATERGINAATPECTYAMYNAGTTPGTDAALTANVLSMNEEFIVNAIYYGASVLAMNNY